MINLWGNYFVKSNCPLLFSLLLCFWEQKCQMPGHYPVYGDCNINCEARGAVRHRDSGKVTLTRWRLAKAGGLHIYLLHWKRWAGPDGCLPQPPAPPLLPPNTPSYGCNRQSVVLLHTSGLTQPPVTQPN